MVLHQPNASGGQANPADIDYVAVGSKVSTLRIKVSKVISFQSSESFYRLFSRQTSLKHLCFSLHISSFGASSCKLCQCSYNNRLTYMHVC